MAESVQKPLGQWQRQGQEQDMANEECSLTKKIRDFAMNILGVTQGYVDAFSIATPHERNLALKELRFNTSLFRKGWLNGEEGKYFRVLDEFVGILNFIDNELGFENTSGSDKADASKCKTWIRNSGIPAKPSPLTNESSDDIEPSHVEAFFLETGGLFRSRMIHSIPLDIQYPAVLLTTPGQTPMENTLALPIGLSKPEPTTKPVAQVTEDNLTSPYALRTATASALTEEGLDFQVQSNEGIAGPIDSKAFKSPSSINEPQSRTLRPVQLESGRKMSKGAAEFWQRLNRRVTKVQTQTMPILSLSKSQGVWNCHSCFGASPLGHVGPAAKFIWEDPDDCSIAPNDLLRSSLEILVFQHREKKLAASMMKSEDYPNPKPHLNDQSDFPKSFWKRIIPDSVLKCFGGKGLKSRGNPQPGSTDTHKPEKKKGFFGMRKKEKNYSPPTWYTSPMLAPDSGSDSSGYVYFPRNSGLGVYRRRSYSSLQSNGKDSVETASDLSVVRFG